MGPTERLAKFVLNTSYEDIPEEAIVVAKQCVMDVLCAMLGGSSERATRIAMKYVKDSGGVPEAGVIGGEFRTSLTNAVLVNGIAAHALELETYGPDTGAEGFITVPIALNTSEVFKRSGKEVLEAVTLGWELHARITIGSYGAYRRGFNPMSAPGVLAYAAMVSKLLRLNLHDTIMAIALAADQSSGNSQSGYMCHYVETGFAARNGVTAALLAKEGIEGQPDAIEGTLGFWELFAADEYDEDAMVGKLGNPFYFVSPGIIVKKYGCTSHYQAAIDKFSELMKKENIRYDDIEKVDVEVHPMSTKRHRFREPKDGIQAKFSLRHALGSTMLDGKIDPLRPFSDIGAQDPQYKEAGAKVNIIGREDWKPLVRKHTPTLMTITLKDGRSYSTEAKVAEVKGSKKNPLTRAEFLDRCKTCAGTFLSPTQIQRTIDLVDNLENLPDISELMELVTFGRRV